MARAWPDMFLRRARQGLESRRDRLRATQMARYMKGLFPYAGVPSPAVTEVIRGALDGLARPSQPELVATVEHLWELPDREYQYIGCALLARNMRAVDASLLAFVETLVTRKSWWDTVDALASSVVGPLVGSHPELGEEMDRWAMSDNIWLARTAILHQLRLKGRTDADRLFRYCLERAGDREFFVRKAIGWALREYSKTDARTVVAFIAAHEDVLSPLSRREALKWLLVRESGQRAAAAAGLDLAGSVNFSRRGP